MIKYFISKEQLKDERKDEVRFTRVINQSIQTRSRQPRYNEVTVFLSHRHDDIDVMNNVISLLKGCGVDVYVDWMDYEMPKQTSGLTAKLIKEKILACNKFILVATEGAITSKWCNWELGFGDAHKYRDNIAIMPITDKPGGTFSGSEYLQIYPSIKTICQQISAGYYVVDESLEIPLKDWLIK